jgi:hypothetical protein
VSALITQTEKKLRSRGIPEERIQIFLRQAKRGTYRHMLRVCKTWLDQGEKWTTQPY